MPLLIGGFFGGVAATIVSVIALVLITCKVRNIDAGK